ncbi:hypothetical protein CQA37_09595 [Helicobacter sp. MIT 99-10781]|uniref:hypothetical protein n=1 Tax=unclassified Helicobacter TaxID=2593540 RepID=UPI000E373F84|nr:MULTISPECIES: hypothetical protein [unclassified Helicobacter]RDU51581.1 hypothetical protein CQA37_09595 [Helicobacter sp. MIT 99-10781]
MFLDTMRGVRGFLESVVDCHAATLYCERSQSSQILKLPNGVRESCNLINQNKVEYARESEVKRSWSGGEAGFTPARRYNLRNIRNSPHAKLSFQ